MTPLTTGCGFNTPEWFLLRSRSITSSTADNMIKACNGHERELSDQSWCEDSWSSIKAYRKGFHSNDRIDNNHHADDRMNLDTEIKVGTSRRETGNGENNEQEGIVSNDGIEGIIQHHIIEISKGSVEGRNLTDVYTGVLKRGVDGVLESTNAELPDFTCLESTNAELSDFHCDGEV